MNIASVAAFGGDTMLMVVCFSELCAIRTWWAALLYMAVKHYHSVEF